MMSCFEARDANTGTHDGNIVKGQWTQSEIHQRLDAERRSLC